MTNGIPDLLGDTAMGNKTSIMTNGATEEMALELTATGKPKMVFDKDYNPATEEGRHNLIQLAIADSDIPVETTLQQAAVKYMRRSTIGLNDQKDTHVRTAVYAFQGVRAVEHLLTEEQKTNELIQNFLNSTMATYKHFDWDINEEFEVAKNCEPQMSLTSSSLELTKIHPLDPRALNSGVSAGKMETKSGLMSLVSDFRDKLLYDVIKEVFQDMRQVVVDVQEGSKMKLATILVACTQVLHYLSQIEEDNVSEGLRISGAFYTQVLRENHKLYEQEFNLGNTGVEVVDVIYKAAIEALTELPEADTTGYDKMDQHYNRVKDYYEGHYKAMYYGE